LPEVFDVYNIRKSFNVPSPTQVVLLQELERFNLLIQKMHSTIADLKRALKGEIGMSVDLDILGNSFFNGFLPPLWANLAP
jgi:dynein heavy chain